MELSVIPEEIRYFAQTFVIKKQLNIKGIKFLPEKKSSC